MHWLADISDVFYYNKSVLNKNNLKERKRNDIFPLLTLTVVKIDNKPKKSR